jgi:hypothetical protein
MDADPAEIVAVEGNVQLAQRRRTTPSRWRSRSAIQTPPV